METAAKNAKTLRGDGETPVYSNLGEVLKFTVTKSNACKLSMPVCIHCGKAGHLPTKCRPN